MTLNILTPRGQQTLIDEIAAAAIFERSTGLSYIRTPDHLPARVDAVITKAGHIAGVVETKCRYGVTRANLRDGWKDEWLVTMEKIEQVKAAASAMCVPFYGFLFLVDEGLLLTQMIADETGQYCVRFRVDRTETQKNVNGGSVVRCNAFIDMSNAKEWR